MPTSPSASRPPLKDRLRQLIVEYGSLALWVYFGIFAIVLIGFAIAFRFGLNPDGAAGTAGLWGAAYLSTKLTQPLRIIATLALTPLVMHVVRRVRRPRKPDAPSSQSSGSTTP